MTSVWCFSVLAEAVPGSLPRVLDVFARHDHVPERLHCHVVRGARDELVIDAQLDGLDGEEAGAVARHLGRLVTVTRVLTTEKSRQAV